MAASLASLSSYLSHMLAIATDGFAALTAELLVTFGAELLLPGLAAAAADLSHMLTISTDGFAALFSGFLNCHIPSLVFFSIHFFTSFHSGCQKDHPNLYLPELPHRRSNLGTIHRI